MKNGSSLERLAHIIQDSLKDNPETKIKRNKKLRDSEGDLREFDVIVNASSNSYPIVIAIECKDYNRKVERKEIEAFITKCSDFPQINIKIFVSSKGFQSGAIKTAKRFGVLLYTLEDLNSKHVKKWLLPQTINKLNFQYQFANWKLIPNYEGNKKNLPKLRHPLIGQSKSGQDINLSEIVAQFFNQNKSLPFALANIGFIKNQQKKPLPFSITEKIRVKIDDFHVLGLNNQLIPVSGVLIDLIITIDSNPITTKRRVFSKNEGDIVAQIMSSQIGKDYLDFAYKKKDSSFLGYCNNDRSIRRLKLLGTYDPESDAWMGCFNSEEE